ncbi:MAG: discoidin domain-containing protein [Verrucomicrobiota bacterium]
MITTMKDMLHKNATKLMAAALLAGGLVCSNLSLTAADLEPLPLKLPMPAFKGTPGDIPKDSTAEKPSGKPRPTFLAPKGCKNVALNKKVTASDKSPMTGAPELVTDGNKEATESSVLIMRKGTQYVQIDLAEKFEIHALLLWHAHDTPKIYRDVVVQVADDEDFIDNVRTIFNNDQDNSSGLGIGTDREYFEGYEGKLIEVKGVTARYVRLYSRGSTDSALNEYTEVEVWALPAK